MNFIKLTSRVFRPHHFINIDGTAGQTTVIKRTVAGTAGSGVTRSGDPGRAAKEGVGGIGKAGAAREDSYFYDKQRQQLQELKDKLEKNMDGHNRKKEE